VASRISERKNGGQSRVDGIDPACALTDPKREDFSQLCAAGVRPRKAYVRSGFINASNSHRLMKESAVVARIEYLAQIAAHTQSEYAELNKTYLLTTLRQAMEQAMEGRRYFAVLKAAEMLGRTLGLFVVQPKHFDWDGKISSLNLQQLANYKRDLLIRVYGSDSPETLERARRELLGKGPSVSEPAVQAACSDSDEVDDGW
jgi:hypothetical protein